MQNMVNKTLHYILNISIKIMSHKLRIYLRKIPAVMFTETLIVWPTLIWLTSPRTAIQCIAFPSWDDLGLSSIYDYFMINRLLTIFNGNYIPRNFWRQKQFRRRWNYRWHFVLPPTNFCGHCHFISNNSSKF